MNRIVHETPEHDAWLELRKHDLTSTDIAALFGVSKYKTEYQVWTEKSTGNITPFKSNERVTWGNRLEDAVARGIAEDSGMDCWPYKHYVRLPDYRLGSSFDYLLSDGGLLEIKCVDPRVFASDWRNLGDGQFLAPDHIELQVQHQMLVSGMQHAYIGVLVGGNRTIPLQRRTLDDTVRDQIIERATSFWASVDEGTAPECDLDNETDVSALMLGFAHAEPGLEMDGTPEINDLVARYLDAGARESAARKEKAPLKAQILQLIGESEVVQGEGYKITAGMIGPCEYTTERKGYRAFKVTRRKKNR